MPEGRDSKNEKLRTPTIADQLLDYLYDRAKTKLKNQETPLIDAATLEEFRRLQEDAKIYDGSAADKEQNLKRMILSCAQLSPKRQLAIANLMTAQTIVLNAINNMDRARTVPGPYDRFSTFFKNGLEGQDPESFIKLLKETKEQMLISIVQTMHPTVYHTEFGRRKETEITQALEKMVPAIMRHKQVLGGKSEPFEDAKAAIDDLLLGLKQKKTVTHAEQVTVPQENKGEQENFVAMNKALAEVVNDYNRALGDAMKRVSEGQRLELGNCFIDTSQFEQRTWARSADADGREKATSIELYKAVDSAVNPKSAAAGQQGKYEGPKLDCRENKKQHEDCIGGIIQTNYRKSLRTEKNKPSAFSKFCDEFAKREKANNPNWKSAQESIFQQMTPDNQAEFVKQLIVSDYQLVPQEMREDTLAFNAMFTAEYKKFLTDYKDALHKALPDVTSLDEISLEKLSNIWIAYPGPKDKERPLARILEERMNAKGYVLKDDFSYERNQFDWYRGYFSQLEMPRAEKNSAGETVLAKGPMFDEERKKLVDVIKRLYIMDDAIGRFGKDVADRYQIANFEKTADFYNAMLLFKEAGLLTIENGKVSKKSPPKLAIQPLLETADDMENAPALFAKLLDDPLAQSYYEACGNKAQIMLGFSDGAKSAGNFASEWAIRQCAARMKTLFFERGIKLRIFQGRGRGPDRGGHFEEGNDMLMMPPEVQQDMVLDVTLQSDRPLDMAASPAYARDTFASMITGTITAKRMANEKAKQSDVLTASLASQDTAITDIAKTAEREYRRLVSENPSTLTFINNMHDNPLKTSRKASRGGKNSPFKDTRAITIEYAFNLADAPLHNIGLKAALEKMVAEGKEVLDKDGNPVKGEAALQVMYNTHPFFRGMIDKTIRGMRNYDSAIFCSYAKAIGVEPWARECAKELDGLREMLQNIRSRASGFADRIRPSDNAWRAESYLPDESIILGAHSNTLDTTAHALALSTAVEGGEIKEGSRPFKPNPHQEEVLAKVMKFLVFTLAGEVSHRGTPPEITASVNGQRPLAR